MRCHPPEIFKDFLCEKSQAESVDSTPNQRNYKCHSKISDIQFKSVESTQSQLILEMREIKTNKSHRCPQKNFQLVLIYSHMESKLFCK